MPLHINLHGIGTSKICSVVSVSFKIGGSKQIRKVQRHDYVGKFFRNRAQITLFGKFLSDILPSLKPPPPNGPKVSNIFHNFTHVYFFSHNLEWNRIRSKCLKTHIFQSHFSKFSQGQVPTPAILDNLGWTKVLGKRGHKHSDVKLKLQQLGIFVQYF